MNNILKAWNAGLVRRWHTQPELCDTVDYDSGHQQRCTIMLLLFWPDATREELIDSLIHDQGECDAGDMAAPAKQKYPLIADDLWEVELASIAAQGFTMPHLRGERLRRRKFVDYMDSYVWMLRHKATMRKKPEWERQLAHLISEAEALGIGQKFTDFMTSAIKFYAP